MGLTLFEAMSLGKPVIATGWSGNMDFMSADNSFPVKYQLVPLDQDYLPYRAGQIWADPSVDDAAALMRYVFEHPLDAEEVGRHAAADISRGYSPAAIGALIASRLRALGKLRENERRPEHGAGGVSVPSLARLYTESSYDYAGFPPRWHFNAANQTTVAPKVTKAILPKVSVLIPSYNHAAFIGHAIQSVINQSFQDFEILIGDDASTDDTMDILSGFSDPRITITYHNENRGQSATVNDLLRNSRGEYIAHLNSDDYWDPGKLERQVEFMDKHQEYGVIFSDAIFVDENNEPVCDSPNSYADTNRSRGGWLRSFFGSEFHLCYPSSLVRKSCFEEVGFYNTRLRQIPDFDMWVRIIKKFEIFVSDERLVFFRWIYGKNVSTPTAGNLQRFFAEKFLVSQRFFDGVDREILADGFSDLLVFRNLPSEIHCDIEKSLLFFRAPRPFGPVYRVVGMEKLAFLLASDPHREVLRRDYQFNEAAFHRLTAFVDALGSAADIDAASGDLDDLIPLPGGGIHSTGSPIIKVQGLSEAGGSAEPPDNRGGDHVVSFLSEAEWHPLLQRAIDALDEGRLEEGRAACLALLSDGALPWDVREVVYLNQPSYAQSLDELVPGVTTRKLTWPVAKEAIRREPSPVVLGDRLLAVARVTLPSPDAPRRDVLLTLDEGLRVTESVALRDETGLADRFDDVRPFALDGNLYAAVILYDAEAEEWTQAGIVAIEDGVYRDLHCLGPRAGYFHGGWAPVATPSGARVIAWWEPTEVMRFDPLAGTFARQSLRFAPRVTERFWAGSQGVAIPGGCLVLVNEEVAATEDDAQIFSRFVHLDETWQVTAVSPQFFVGQPGEDVASGLALRGDRLIAGFTVGNRAALLASMDLPVVLATLTPVPAPGRATRGG
jgi:glycosyltransferase involved in cell wall biosynthesis